MLFKSRVEGGGEWFHGCCVGTMQRRINCQKGKISCEEKASESTNLAVHSTAPEPSGYLLLYVKSSFVSVCGMLYHSVYPMLKKPLTPTRARSQPTKGGARGLCLLVEGP